MAFSFHSKQLERLCKQNAFEIPANTMIFFGLRGCLPVNPNNHAVVASQNNGYDAERMTMLDDEPVPMRLRYGSTGPLVTEVQTRLKAAGFFPPEPSGEFGVLTLRSVVAFQRAKFGPSSGDGIVGPMTAEALGRDGRPEV